MGQGWISREAASYEEVARSIESISKSCADAGRDLASVGFRVSLTPTPPEGGVEARPLEAIADQGIENGRRLAALGVTHFSVPANYYQLSVEQLGELLDLLKAA
jgi:hypothetical protein